MSWCLRAAIVAKWFRVGDALLREAVREFAPEAADDPSAPFAFPSAPCDARTYLLQRTLYERVCARDCDELFAQETFVEILRNVIAAAYGAPDYRDRCAR